MLIKFLIIFFLLLILYQIYVDNFWVVEGLTDGSGGGLGSENSEFTTSPDSSSPPTYQPYNQNDAIILGKQNAGNIIVLKQQVDKLNADSANFGKMEQEVNQLSTQVQGLVKQQASYAQSVAGPTPPTITGM